jgi:hypothetical protein
MTTTLDPTARSAVLRAAVDARRHPAKRTAVVLVHGVGEQAPMATLRAFVRKYRDHRPAGPARDCEIYSVPDRCDRRFHLHSYIVKGADPAAPQLDFYEGYWAPDVTGTRWTHLGRWVLGMCLRPPRSLPRRLRGVQCLVWLVLAGLVAGYAALGWAIVVHGPTLRYLVPSLLPLLAGLLAPLLLDGIGDAARYLDDHPKNLQARFAVRRNIVELLDRLHEARRYDEIVVVGHSLGGVVAYDALRLLWAKRTRGVDVGDLPEEVFHDVPSLFGALATLPGGRRIWRVSHLVTVGAPLAYADLLLASKHATFEDLVVERELPTAPPQDVDRVPGRYWFTEDDPDGKVLHHGAMFAATRWVNVYGSGDLVGGPVNGPEKHGLGPAVENRELRDGAMRIPVRSHTRYWDDAQFWRLFDGIVSGGWPTACPGAPTVAAPRSEAGTGR